MSQPEKLGPYRLERLLGRGGMGAVYAGRNEETGERAAVKLLSPAFASEPNFRGRFAAEIETLKKLRHPNIVQLYGFGEEDGFLFYAMQLVDADNLETELRKGRHFDWRDVIAIGLDVCKALKHAHDRGVIHRDLKPANFLRGDDDRILLSDFGIAKLFGGTEFTSAGGVIGTADYMAPEQAAGEGVSARSDLYSLGASLFCLLAGRPPFQGRSIPDIIHQVRYSDAPLVGRFAPTTPVELEGIIARLLEKDPKKRIPTALALTNLLQSMAQSAPKTIVDENAPPPPDDDFELSTEISTGASSPQDPAANKPTIIVAPPVSSRTGHEATMIHTAPPVEELQAPPPPPTPTSRFTTVSAEELGKLDAAPEATEEAVLDWVKIGAGLAAFAVFALLAWYATRPPSADGLYEKIAAAVETDAPGDAANEIETFLEKFPDDPRAAEVQAYRQDIELARLERMMERRARTGSMADGLPLVERTYLEAIQTARSDPRSAAEKLEAMIAVFGAQPSDDARTRAYVELARKQLDRLRVAMEEAEQADRKTLEERLAKAESMHQNDAEAAQAIWRGVVALYDGKPWAESFVEQAKTRLSTNAP